jgi:hypothetical protein
LWNVRNVNIFCTLSGKSLQFNHLETSPRLLKKQATNTRSTFIELSTGAIGGMGWFQGIPLAPHSNKVRKRAKQYGPAGAGLR